MLHGRSSSLPNSDRNPMPLVPHESPQGGMGTTTAAPSGPNVPSHASVHHGYVGNLLVKFSRIENPCVLWVKVSIFITFSFYPGLIMVRFRRGVATHVPPCLLRPRVQPHPRSREPRWRRKFPPPWGTQLTSLPILPGNNRLNSSIPNILLNSNIKRFVQLFLYEIVLVSTRSHL